MGMFQNVEKNEINEERGVEKIGMLRGGKITIEVILIEKPLSFKNVYHKI